ncbi:MAG: DUF1858 domain-containing protein [bacterium]|nr:DUF1858 domain-containing protein [bacterium]
MITEHTTIEELVRLYPVTVRYLMQKGIKCIACGEPIWGTLGSAVREKGYNQQFLESCIIELNELIQKEATR